MFLSFFPFTEVVCIISVVLAWIYIALGIFGSNAVNADIKAENNLRATQEEHVQTSIISSVDNSKCFWVNISTDYSAESLEISKFEYKNILPPKIVKLKEYLLAFYSVCSGKNNSNRAPPYSV